MIAVRTVGLLMVLAATVLTGGCEQTAPSAGLQPGQPFPTVTLVRLDGRVERSSDYQGRLLVLNVWAPWCRPCVREMPSLQRLNVRLDPRRFAVIGLTVDDDRFLVEEFVNKHDIRFPNYITQGNALVNEVLGVRAFPETLIVAPDGTLLHRIVGQREWDSAEMVAFLERAYAEASGATAADAGRAG